MSKKAGPRTMWLKCKVTRGMFPDEVAVVVEVVEGVPVSFFLARNDVRLRESEQAIPVSVLRSEGKVRVIALPQPSLEGPSVVRVPEEALIGA